MTFIELVQKTWALSGLTGTGPGAVTDQSGLNARMVLWVQEAYLDVQKAHTNWGFHWKETPYDQTLTVGESYAVPTAFSAADYRKLDRAWIAEPLADPLASPQTEEFRWAELEVVRHPSDVTDIHLQTVTGGETQGKPSKLYLFPTGRQQSTATWEFNSAPDKEYPFKFSYWMDYHELADDADEPVIPAKHQMTIVWKALEYYSYYDEDTAINTLAERKYLQALHRLEREELPPMRFAVSPFLG